MFFNIQADWLSKDYGRIIKKGLKLMASTFERWEYFLYNDEYWWLYIFQAGTMFSNFAKLGKRSSLRSWHWSVHNHNCHYIHNLLFIIIIIIHNHGIGWFTITTIIIIILNHHYHHSQIIFIPNFEDDPNQLMIRWGWQASLCMCADYKKPCRSGFKTQVSLTF